MNVLPISLEKLTSQDLLTKQIQSALSNKYLVFALITLSDPIKRLPNSTMYLTSP